MGSKRTITPSHSTPLCNSTGLRRPQIKKLVAKLDRARVHQRVIEGKTIDYLEGWFVVSEANAIFGFDGWDRETLHMEKVFEQTRFQETQCAYSARVRVRVKAGTAFIIREGSGFGEASAACRAAAHERALKAAETDATKRALATFGNRFGLCLYDKEQTGVTGALAASTAPSAGISEARKRRFILRGPAKEVISDDLSAEAFCAGLRQVIEKIGTLPELEELNAANRETLLLLRQLRQDLRSAKGVHFSEILQRLLDRRKQLLQGQTQPPLQQDHRREQTTAISGVPGRSSNDPTGENSPIRTEYGFRAAALTEAAPTSTLALSDSTDNGEVASMRGGTDQALNGGPTNSAGKAADQPELRTISSSLGMQASDGPTSADRSADNAEKQAQKVPTGAQRRAGRKLDCVARPPIPEPVTRARTRSRSTASGPPSRYLENEAEGAKIDKSQLPIRTERRVRSKAHLLFIASQPCLICGELPCHAHHLTFAQPRGLSVKVSDEFTVPLCAVHHNVLHQRSNERAFWQQHDIDALKIAAGLWARSLEDLQ